jgi:hypothetical protein
VSMAPEAVRPFMNRAMDGMVRLLDTLGDARVNQRPPLPYPNLADFRQVPALVHKSPTCA